MRITRILTQRLLLWVKIISSMEATMFIMNLTYPLLLLTLCADFGCAADTTEHTMTTPHLSWAELRNARWPGNAAHEDEYGPAVDGVRLATRVLPIRDPAAQHIAVAVTVWNDNDVPMSFYGFGWSADLLPHEGTPRSQARYIGGPRPTWYGTLTMQAQEHLS